MLMTWSSRERNRSCSPLSRRSRGRIEPPPITFEGRESRLQIRGNPHHQFARKSAPQLQFPANPVARNSGNFYCQSIASGYFTDDDSSLIFLFERDLRANASRIAPRWRGRFDGQQCKAPLSTFSRRCKQRPRLLVKLPVFASVIFGIEPTIAQSSHVDPKLTFTMPSLPKYSVRHEESVCNSRATHSQRLRRSSFRSEAGLCRSTVRRMPMNSNAATGQ